MWVCISASIYFLILEMLVFPHRDRHQSRDWMTTITYVRSSRLTVQRKASNSRNLLSITCGSRTIRNPWYMLLFTKKGCLSKYVRESSVKNAYPQVNSSVGKNPLHCVRICIFSTLHFGRWICSVRVPASSQTRINNRFLRHYFSITIPWVLPLCRMPLSAPMRASASGRQVICVVVPWNTPI